MKYKFIKGFLYCDKTVVLSKSDVKNAKDEEFKEVTLLISEEFIRDTYEELEFLDEEDEEVE